MANYNSNYPAAKLSQVPDIGNYLKEFDEIMKIPPCRKSDPEGVRERISKMFQYCEENNRRPTVELLSAFIGVSRMSLWKWQQDETSEAGKLIEQAKALINAFLTELALTGNAPYPYVIWSQKNNEGYKEVVEILPGNKESELPEKEQIIKSLPEQLPDEIELELDELLGGE